MKRSTVILNQTVNWPEAGIPGLTGLEICVQLTRGYLAIVDAEDAEDLSSVNWCADLQLTRQQVRAVRNSPRDEHGKQHPILMHRQLMKPMVGQEVDHRDQHIHFVHKLVDNRRENLRNVSVSQNAANQRKQVGCSSRFKGVCWNKRDEKWAAGIRVNGRSIYLGIFTSQEEAAHTYNQAHQHYFPGIAEGINLIAI